MQFTKLTEFTFFVDRASFHEGGFGLLLLLDGRFLGQDLAPHRDQAALGALAVTERTHPLVALEWHSDTVIPASRARLSPGSSLRITSSLVAPRPVPGGKNAGVAAKTTDGKVGLIY
ncbi:hypothetical protein ISCGN_004246 [Ixodes scapularis]